MSVLLVTYMADFFSLVADCLHISWLSGCCMHFESDGNEILRCFCTTLSPAKQLWQPVSARALTNDYCLGVFRVRTPKVVVA